MDRVRDILRCLAVRTLWTNEAENQIQEFFETRSLARWKFFLSYLITLFPTDIKRVDFRSKISASLVRRNVYTTHYANDTQFHLYGLDCIYADYVLITWTTVIQLWDVFSEPENYLPRHLEPGFLDYAPLPVLYRQQEVDDGYFSS